MSKYFIIIKTTCILLWIFHELTLFFTNLLKTEYDSFSSNQNSENN